MPRLRRGVEVASAWEAVQEHLPATWSVLELLRMEPGRGFHAWYASAGAPGQRGYDPAEVIEGEGPTPAHALRALAEALRKRRERRGPHRGHPRKDPHLPPRPSRSPEAPVLYRSPELRQPSMTGWGSEDLEHVG